MNFHDLSMVLAWRNHKDIRRYMFTQHEIGLEEHRIWFANAQSDSARRLLIVEDANSPFGYVQFRNVATGGIADWGFYVRPGAPRGCGRQLGIAALNHAFHTLNLHKVCGSAIDSNLASIALHNRLGFVREGVLRDQCVVGLEYHNTICFGLLAHEWNPELDLLESSDANN